MTREGCVVGIYRRKKVTINTDPQRRCYNGCHASSEEVWTEWELFEEVQEENTERRLAFWRGLNAYAVSQRGESARTEYEVRGHDGPQRPQWDQ
jgi:hypothetical protein